MSTRTKIILISGLVITTTILHYITNPHAGAAHDIYQRFYYLPVILAGIWFGVKGGLITAFCICILYLPHAVHGWHGPYSTFYRLMEIGMYHVVGALTGYFSAIADKAYREKEVAYDRLHKKTAELFTMEEQLRRSDRLAALGKLSAGLAHEIKNPLASIKTAAEILNKKKTPAYPGASLENHDDQPDFHRILLEETERLDRILNDFLNFARTERNQDNGDPKSCKIDTALSKTADLLKPEMEKRNISFQFNHEDLAIKAKIAESSLRQVFLNLFLNAIEAMPDGGKIIIDNIFKQNDSISFCIKDTGPGIPLDVAGHIFDPFYSTKEGGTGLGLSIVERIMNSNGGRIFLDPENTPNSCFNLTLPLG